MIINSSDIKEFRKKHKLTQEKLADLIGVSWRTIQNYETGKVIPKSKITLFRVVFEKYNQEKKLQIEDEKHIDVSNLEKLSLDEIALFAAQNIEQLKKKSVFYNTFVMEALSLIKEVQNDDGSINPDKLTFKD